MRPCVLYFSFVDFLCLVAVAVVQYIKHCIRFLLFGSLWLWLWFLSTEIEWLSISLVSLVSLVSVVVKDSVGRSLDLDLGLGRIKQSILFPLLAPTFFTRMKVHARVGNNKLSSNRVVVFVIPAL